MWFPNKALVSFESCNQYENFLKWCEPEYFMGAVEPQEEFEEADIDWAGLL